MTMSSSTARESISKGVWGLARPRAAPVRFAREIDETLDGQSLGQTRAHRAARLDGVREATHDFCDRGDAPVFASRRRRQLDGGRLARARHLLQGEPGDVIARRVLEHERALVPVDFDAMPRTAG